MNILYIILAILYVISAILFFLDERYVNEGKSPGRTFRNGFISGLNLVFALLFILKVFAT